MAQTTAFGLRTWILFALGRKGWHRANSLAFVARAAVRFDEACGFAALLTGIRIFDELK